LAVTGRGGQLELGGRLRAGDGLAVFDEPVLDVEPGFFEFLEADFEVGDLVHLAADGDAPRGDGLAVGGRRSNVFRLVFQPQAVGVAVDELVFGVPEKMRAGDFVVDAVAAVVGVDGQRVAGQAAFAAGVLLALGDELVEADAAALDDLDQVADLGE